MKFYTNAHQVYELDVPNKRVRVGDGEWQSFESFYPLRISVGHSVTFDWGDGRQLQTGLVARIEYAGITVHPEQTVDWGAA